MSDTSPICQALTKIAWGYVLLFLNFNLGINGHTMDILPNWLGYLLFFSAIGLLGTQLRDLTLLKPFCILLGVLSAVDWGTVLLTGQELLDGFFLLSILRTCLSIYFSFQLLTDLALLSESYGIQANRLRVCRNIDAVIKVLPLLPLPWDTNTLLSALLIGLLIFGLIICLFIVCQLFTLRKCFREGTPQI